MLHGSVYFSLDDCSQHLKCQNHSTVLTAEEIPEEASWGLKQEAALDMEQQCVKLGSQL